MPATADAAGAPASQTLSRGIRILEVLADSREPMSIDDVARALEVHRSIAYRLVRTLEHHGLVSRDASGRVAQVIIGGVPVPGTELRSIFSLRSTAFDLEWTGEVFRFTVSGSGHGVGLSQQGARLMAGQGCTWQEILAHYYPGTELRRAEG